MATFQAKIKDLSLNIGKYTKTLDKTMQVQTRQAARAWLRAVIPKIPVYSGESRASLLPLGGFLRVAIPINPSDNAIKRYKGDRINVGALQGFFNFDSSDFVYTFQFDTQVAQFLINEFHVGLGSPPLLNETPWHAFEAGEDAFDQYLNENILPKLPKIFDFTVGFE